MIDMQTVYRKVETTLKEVTIIGLQEWKGCTSV
jgi:hypothetical protein